MLMGFGALHDHLPVDDDLLREEVNVVAGDAEQLSLAAAGAGSGLASGFALATLAIAAGFAAGAASLVAA